MVPREDDLYRPGAVAGYAAPRLSGLCSADQLHAHELGPPCRRAARFFDHLVEGDEDSAEKHRVFYDEYLAVLDLTEEFYLQTIRRVFREHRLARGKFKYRGERKVDPGKITSVGLMTVRARRMIFPASARPGRA